MELQKINQSQNGLQRQQTNSLEKYLQSIPASAPEKQILGLKYSAVPFVKMSAEQVYDAAEIALLKISVITGWELQAGPLQIILVDQLTKHLRESYLTVNMNEIEYAFRQFGSSVKDWGKSMNLVLFDQVMNQYMRARMEASEAERNRPQPTGPLIEGPKKTNAEKIEIARGLWDTMGKVDFIYPDSFQALVDEKLIKYPMDKEVQKKYMAKAELRVTEIGLEDRTFFNTRDREEWKRIYARKLVVADYFLGNL